MVDDEKDILDLFSDYLSSNGLKTISFQNPIEALEYFYQTFKYLRLGHYSFSIDNT
ncbi:MAG: hypothetical protein ACM3VV_01375 [Deltaproteobacteria bacterium]